MGLFSKKSKRASSRPNDSTGEASLEPHASDASAQVGLSQFLDECTAAAAAGDHTNAGETEQQGPPRSIFSASSKGYEAGGDNSSISGAGEGGKYEGGNCDSVQYSAATNDTLLDSQGPSTYLHDAQACLGSSAHQLSTSMGSGIVPAGMATGTDRALVVQTAGALATAGGERSLVQYASQEVAVATVSAALIAGGVSSVVAPVLAVVVVVGCVVMHGVTRYVERRLRVRVDQNATQLGPLQHLARTQTPEHFTMVINGTGTWGDDDNKQYYNAFLSSASCDGGDDATRQLASYAPVNPDHLQGISKLISSDNYTKCTVRDMGGFTAAEEGARPPFSVRLCMPDVLALIRQSWEYEKFSETKCGTMTVLAIRPKQDTKKSAKSSAKLRVAWYNGAGTGGAIDATEAMVYTEKEWKSTKYAGKTKPMPEGFADVDVALDRCLVFV